MSEFLERLKAVDLSGQKRRAARALRKDAPKSPPPYPPYFSAVPTGPHWREWTTEECDLWDELHLNEFLYRLMELWPEYPYAEHGRWTIYHDLLTRAVAAKEEEPDG